MSPAKLEFYHRTVIPIFCVSFNKSWFGQHDDVYLMGLLSSLTYKAKKVFKDTIWGPHALEDLEGLPFFAGTKTAAAMAVVQRPFLSPIAV